MSPSHAQLMAASDEEMPDVAPPKPSRWRGLGLAVTVVGLVCMVGANWPKKEVYVSPHQRLGQMRDAMMEAFSARNLKEASSLTSKFEFVLGETDGEDPSAMEMNARLVQGEDSDAPFGIQFVFNAQEGKGETLKGDFDAVLGEADMLSAIFEEKTDEEGQPLLPGPLAEMIKVTQEGDTVSVTVTPDAAAEAEATAGAGITQNDTDKFEDLFENGGPEFGAILKFGRGLDGLHGNMDKSVLTVWNGLHFSFDAKFKVILSRLMETALRCATGGFGGGRAGGGGSPGGGENQAAKRRLQGSNGRGGLGGGDGPPGPADFIDWFKGLSKIGYRVELRYKTEEELGDLFANMPTFEDLFHQITSQLSGAPSMFHPLIRDLRNLERSIDGMKSAEVTGLPANYAINVDFTNVRPVMLFGKLIDESKVLAEPDE